MVEYIEREALIAAFYSDAERCGDPETPWDLSAIETEIEAAPAADVAPVVRGEWIPVIEEAWNLPNPVLVGWQCSECGRREQEKEPYCNCGARMDGDGHE